MAASPREPRRRALPRTQTGARPLRNYRQIPRLAVMGCLRAQPAVIESTPFTDRGYARREELPARALTRKVMPLLAGVAVLLVSVTPRAAA